MHSPVRRLGDVRHPAVHRSCRAPEVLFTNNNRLATPQDPSSCGSLHICNTSLHTARPTPYRAPCAALALPVAVCSNTMPCNTCTPHPRAPPRAPGPWPSTNERSKGGVRVNSHQCTHRRNLGGLVQLRTHAPVRAPSLHPPSLARSLPPCPPIPLPSPPFHVTHARAYVHAHAYAQPYTNRWQPWISEVVVNKADLTSKWTLRKKVPCLCLRPLPPTLGPSTPLPDAYTRNPESHAEVPLDKTYGLTPNLHPVLKNPTANLLTPKPHS